MEIPRDPISTCDPNDKLGITKPRL